jgi:hypothetical protein
MGPIRDLKGVHKVFECLAALSRFVSRLDEKGLPLYLLLKKHEQFSWTVEAQEELDKLKATLAHAPILTPPQGGEAMYLYVATTTQVVSAVIIVERTEEGHALPVQRPVYYISEVLSETKARYALLTVDYRIKVHMDLQADKSPVVVKGPFFPRVVNPRYRIRGTMCNTRIQFSKARKAIF